ncbi:MAG: 30S ribosomal protein S7 [Chloroflexi bacterium]|nr:30S ribosomal protein S7 [Chloroflexota bacterium]MBI3734836.1 30S ribosomal protein S7 [Chloroflexota bacterium]
MPRKGFKKNTSLKLDPKFRNESVSRFVNRLMVQGKRSTALGILYRAMEIAESRLKKPGLEVFEQAVRNASPMLEVRPRRVGGATYQVPMEIRGERRNALAMRWLIQAARNRPGKSMAERLAGELMDAAQNTGNTIKKKEETHKMAEANKAFSHFRW